MPLHLDAITNDSQDSAILDYLLHVSLKRADKVIVSEDNRILHFADELTDALSGERIGKLVFTLRNNEEHKQLEILDIDLTLDAAAPVALRFLEKLPGSSDANEYYDVETAGDEIHLQVETVNRHAVKGELVDTVQWVRACAFPFQLDIYDDLDALNAGLGFPSSGEIKGFAGNFGAPGSLSDASADGEAYSMLVGTVKSVRDAAIRFGERTLSFSVAQVDTALGLLPIALSDEAFDLRELAPNKVVWLYADVKADFAIDQ